MFYVYVLRSIDDGILYKGITSDLKKRLQEHNSGKTRSTKAFIPWKIIYYETFETRIEARSREKFFKSGFGREFLKKVISQ